MQSFYKFYKSDFEKVQQLDECNFISNETLKDIATDTLDIIEFFDNSHKENTEELINPALDDSTE